MSISRPSPSASIRRTGGGPESTLAAHLLGFVNRENTGQYGVEQSYQDALAGSPRVMVAQRDVNGRPMPETSVVEAPGTIGEDIRLTIDAGLQLALEQELLAAWIADEAKSVSAVVMDPYTGAVYAEATYPSYDANDYRTIAKTAPNRFIDPVVSNVYEPGSVFKMMTAVSALEAGTVTPDDAHQGRRARCASTAASRRSTTPTTRAWAGSRSRTASPIRATSSPRRSRSDSVRRPRESATMLYDTWRKLGFGQATGIDVAGETVGRGLRPRPGRLERGARSTSPTARSARASR